MELTWGSSLPISVHKCWPPFMRIRFHSWEAVVCSSTVVFVRGGCRGGSWLSMGVVSLSVGAGHLWVSRGHSIFMAWVVVVNGGVVLGHLRFVSGSRLWALDVCGWVVVVVNRGVIWVVSRLWVVGVVHVGVVFIHLRAIMVVRGCPCVGSRIRSWAVVVMWVVFILVGGRRLWVLVVKRGVVVVVFLSLSSLVVLGCGCSWC